MNPQEKPKPAPHIATAVVASGAFPGTGYTDTLKKRNPVSVPSEKELFDGHDWFTKNNRVQKNLNAVHDDKNAWMTYGQTTAQQQPSSNKQKEHTKNK